jgi:hypothetical protein
MNLRLMSFLNTNWASNTPTSKLTGWLLRFKRERKNESLLASTKMSDSLASIKGWLEDRFLLVDRESSIAQEFRAATATFLTMSYILLVNPQLLSKLGIAPTAIVVSTALASFVGSFIAGFFGYVHRSLLWGGF